MIVINILCASLYLSASLSRPRCRTVRANGSTNAAIALNHREQFLTNRCRQVRIGLGVIIVRMRAPLVLLRRSQCPCCR